MKRTKNLMLLLGVLAALCAAILLVTGVQRHMDRIATTDEEILAVDSDALTRISWEQEGKTLTFVKTDGIWYSTEDETFPVDQEQIEEFLAHYESVRASFIIEEVEDFGQYGLASPSCTVTLTSEEGESVVRMGDYSTMDSKRYLTLGDGTVYLIDDDLMEYISTERDDFMQQDGVPEYDTIDTIQWSGETDFSAVYLPEETLSYTDEYVYYLEADGGYKALSTGKVKGFVSRLAGLDYTGYATYNASQADLAEYGLDAPDASVTVTITRDEEQSSFTLRFGRKDEENCYMRMDDSEIIYRVEQETYEEILESGYDTLRPSELLALDWDKVKSVTAVIDGETYEIVHGKDKDTVGETEVDLEDVRNAVDALSVNEFLNDQPTKSQEIELEFQYDDEQYPLLRIALYQYDGENCLAQCDGVTVGLLSRSLAVDLTEAVRAITLGLETE